MVVDKTDAIPYYRNETEGKLVRPANNIMVVDKTDAIPYYRNETEGKLVRPANEPRYEISNNVVYATSKASDQPAHSAV